MRRCNVILLPVFKLAMADGGKCTFSAIPSVVTSTMPVFESTAVTVARHLVHAHLVAMHPFISGRLKEILDGCYWPILLKNSA